MIGMVLRTVAVAILVAAVLVPHAGFTPLPHGQPGLGPSAVDVPVGGHGGHKPPANGNEHGQHFGAGVLACATVCVGANQNATFDYFLAHSLRTSELFNWPRTSLLAQTIGEPGERPPRGSALA